MTLQPLGSCQVLGQTEWCGMCSSCPLNIAKHVCLGQQVVVWTWHEEGIRHEKVDGYRLCKVFWPQDMCQRVFLFSLIFVANSFPRTTGIEKRLETSRDTGVKLLCFVVVLETNEELLFVSFCCRVLRALGLYGPCSAWFSLVLWP